MSKDYSHPCVHQGPKAYLIVTGQQSTLSEAEASFWGEGALDLESEDMALNLCALKAVCPSVNFFTSLGFSWIIMIKGPFCKH